MPDPYVSVVVTAYNRRRYLPEALRSLERQTLDKGRFEVVVVKNFEDPASDEIIRRNGWKNVVADVRALGGMVAVGVEESRGEVVTFLDDDDMYAPERLQVVKRAFEETRDLVYFHNGQVVVDEGGNAIPSAVAAAPLSADVVVGDRAKRVPCSLDYLRVLAKADFNMSSIAVRRDLLGPRELETLRALPYSPDSYLYAAAFAVEGAMYLTPSRLTLYRVHRSNVSALLSPPLAMEHLREGRLRDLREQVRAARLAGMAMRLESLPPIYEIARANCGPLNSYLLDYLRMRFEQILYSPGPPAAGRSSLLELLRAAALYEYLKARHRKLAASAAGLAGALLAGGPGAAGAAAGRSKRPLPRLGVLFWAPFRGVAYYLLQYAPEGLKGRVLDLLLLRELLWNLRAARGR